MTTLELSFPLLATTPIPADHGYLLYSALSRVIPEVHSSNGVAVHPIRGRQFGDRLMSLMPWSSLVLRTTDTRISSLIPLAGKRLNLGDRIVRIGVPQVRPLSPATALRSRLVTIKISDVSANSLDEETFQSAVRRKLNDLQVAEESIITLGKRRTLRIKQKEVVGYEVILEALTAEESLNIQEQGIGGRRHMGCGVFVAFGATPGRTL